MLSVFNCHIYEVGRSLSWKEWFIVICLLSYKFWYARVLICEGENLELMMLGTKSESKPL